MKKIYSESEVSRILQKAVEIQEKESGTGYASGVTLEELQRIAQECGIEASALQTALVQPEEETKASFFNFVETHERVFEGELDLSRTDEVIEAFGDKVKAQGMITIGRTVRIQVISGAVFGTLELTSRNGRTKLKFRQTPFIAYFAGLHLPLILSIVAGSSLMASGRVLMGLASLIGILGIGMLLFTTIANGGKRKARVLVDQLSDRIGEMIGDQPLQIQTGTTAQATAAQPDAGEIHQSLGQ